MTPCIEWAKGRGGGGYAYSGAPRHGTRRVHRQVWIDAHGPIPKGLEVMHLCNNKACTNLEHLQLGTHRENMEMAGRDGLIKNCGHPGNRHAAKKG
jgi:hypothetical protein